MCRSIKRLREGVTPASAEEVHEAARQYIRKVSGFGKPTERHRLAFDRAVAEVEAATARLLADVTTTLAS